MLLNRYILMSEADGGEGSGGSAGGEAALAVSEGAASIEGQEVLDGGADGKGGADAPAFGDEGYKYAGKFDTAQDLEKSYTESVAMHTKKMGELGEKLKGFIGAPEGGEYAIPEGAADRTPEVMDAFNKWGAENGLSQDAYEGLLESIGAAEAQAHEQFIAAEMELLGKDADIRLDNLNDKWTATYGADAADWLAGKAISADDVVMFESILAKSSGGSNINPNGGSPMGEVPITQTQLTEAMMKKDTAGMMKMQTDPEYRRMIDDMTAKFNKQRGGS